MGPPSNASRRRRWTEFSSSDSDAAFDPREALKRRHERGPQDSDAAVDPRAVMEKRSQAEQEAEARRKKGNKENAEERFAKHGLTLLGRLKETGCQLVARQTFIDVVKLESPR